LPTPESRSMAPAAAERICTLAPDSMVSAVRVRQIAVAFCVGSPPPTDSNGKPS